MDQTPRLRSEKPSFVRAEKLGRACCSRGPRSSWRPTRMPTNRGRGRPRAGASLSRRSSNPALATIIKRRMPALTSLKDVREVLTRTEAIPAHPVTKLALGSLHSRSFDLAPSSPPPGASLPRSTRTIRSGACEARARRHHRLHQPRRHPRPGRDSAHRTIRGVAHDRWRQETRSCPKPYVISPRRQQD
jgi:hypothetical protein